jgi:hypothetical protein
LKLSRFGGVLVATVFVGLALRLAVIGSPLGEIDGDEAVVGLMARHIAFLGERPVFYWGQPYLGSLEAFSVAPLFRVFDSNTLLLKLVPTAYSLGFLVLSALLARDLFGAGAGLATAGYLALPPAMWAIWSTKARGGYAELLFLGEALLLATLALSRRPTGRLALLWGILAGLTIWTHLLGAVYLAAAVVFLALARPRGLPLALPIIGVFVGMAPLIIDNLSNGFRTMAALLQPPDLPVDPPAQFVRFFRVGVPVLLGLGQPTTSQALFDQDWPQRPAGHLWVALVAVLACATVLLIYAPGLRRLLACGVDARSAPALLVLLALIVPPVVALTRFGFFVSEPRYALTLYSSIPLFIGAIFRAPSRLVPWSVLGLILAFNVWSLVSTDVRLWRPEDTPDSTTATRAEIVQYLVPQDRHQMYTDYWIGYPLMFETRETVLAYMISGGFNRYVPPADNVQRTPNPAWVFEAGQDSETAFLDRLAALGGQAHVTSVSVYHVYTDVQPLEEMRPVP